MGLNVHKIRDDFPILKKGFVYFDNSCMTLRPRQVVDSINRYYNEFPACAGRSMHQLGNKVTEEAALARKSISKFIGAKKPEELIFTRNTTEAINLVANSFKFEKGDKVLITDKEHNSNLLPWQLLAEKGAIKLKILGSKDDNTFNMDSFEREVQDVKLVSVVHTSNLDGVTNPVKDIVRVAHRNDALVLLDSAQAVPHKDIDVKKLGVDFLAFSGHKMLGPSGIGALYGKKDLLENLNPFMVGGETVKESTYIKRIWEDVPERFEAGLQDYAGIIGFAEAANYLKKIGLKNIEKHELMLNKQLTLGLENLGAVKIIGPSVDNRGGITSFNIGSVDSHQVALLLDKSANIMVRSGAHCVHAWFDKHKIPGSVRASFYLYNTEDEVEFFLKKLKEVKNILN
ncbi:MAG: cysteine desulfurase [Nanoarchaeota archaeon]|nr:cysteine desulfurase [Nanoarchaeota archaeon]MBU1854948.1 cysteine desulfurase [Nanoarchaeota archaeon]